MKILIRKLDDKYYVWKTATWKDEKYIVEGCVIDQTNILSIKEDDRVEYVQCMNCGALIKNDPESIEKHFAAMEAKKDCFNCSNLRINDKRNMQNSFETNNDGTYHYTATSDVILNCSQTYPAKNIDNIDLNMYCKHYRCRKIGVQRFEDTFIKYPDLFDKQITVDLLKAKGYEYETHRNGYFEYDLKSRGTLKACVNELGIIDHFIIRYRWYSVVVFYSEKYNELFYAYSGKYSMRNSNDVSESKHNAVKAKISALYKEANK